MNERTALIVTLEEWQSEREQVSPVLSLGVDFRTGTAERKGLKEDNKSYDWADCYIR